MFDSFQVTYNIFEQSTLPVLREVLNYGKKVIIKEALANGRVFQNDKFQHYNKAYAILEELSKKHNVGIDAIALRFVIESLNPTYILSGASNVSQLKQNLKVLDVGFNFKDLQVLKALEVPSEVYWNERSTLNWD